MATVYNPTIEIGRTWTISVQWSMDGIPVNLTGYTIKSSVTRSIGSTPIYTMQSSNGGVAITNAASGQFSLTLASSVTSSWTKGNLAYDVLATSPGGVATTVFGGTMTVKDVVTK